MPITETYDYTVPVLFMEQNALPVSTSLWIPAFIFLSLSCDCSVYMYAIIPKRKKSFFLQHTSYLLTWPGAAHWCWDAQIALKAWTANRANVADGNVDWMLAVPRVVFTKRWSDKHTGMRQSREYVYVAIGCSSPKDEAGNLCFAHSWMVKIGSRSVILARA